jgi:hypothetical protein
MALFAINAPLTVPLMPMLKTTALDVAFEPADAAEKVI